MQQIHAVKMYLSTSHACHNTADKEDPTAAYIFSDDFCYVPKISRFFLDLQDMEVTFVYNMYCKLFILL